MATNLEKLINLAKNVQRSPADDEKQRRSFAFGNTKIENERVTREMVDQMAEGLKLKHG